MRRLLTPCCWIALVGIWGVVLPSAAQHQQDRSNTDYVRRAVQRRAHEVPSRTVRNRLRTYDAYIRYFSRLAYSRPGVTVNTNFVRALIAAESGGRPHVVSVDGAIGLMQILPETGRRAARELYATGYDFRFVERQRLRTLTRHDLKNPAINILIGCYLLDHYNKNFGNSLARTVGAWNAGPDRVRQYGEAPPYRETLTLIGRVNAYYLFFRRQRQP